LSAAGAAEAGLCASCVHARWVASKRSRFLRCGRSDADPAFPRYPALPVSACAGFELAGKAAAPAVTEPLE
jgi:hypothetical protein